MNAARDETVEAERDRTIDEALKQFVEQAVSSRTNHNGGPAREDHPIGYSGGGNQLFQRTWDREVPSCFSLEMG